MSGPYPQRWVSPLSTRALGTFDTVGRGDTGTPTQIFVRPFATGGAR